VALAAAHLAGLELDDGALQGEGLLVERGEAAAVVQLGDDLAAARR